MDGGCCRFGWSSQAWVGDGSWRQEFQRVRDCYKLLLLSLSMLLLQDTREVVVQQRVKRGTRERKRRW